MVAVYGRHLLNPTGVEPSCDRSKGACQTLTALEHQEVNAEDAELVSRLRSACIVCDERQGNETKLFTV